MRTRARGVLRACLAGVGLWAVACEAPPADPEARLRRHVVHLASEAFEGRGTGSVGERLAARYIADHFSTLALPPAADGGYFQPFPFTAGVRLGARNELHAEGDALLALDDDWRPLAFSESGAYGPAAVVFGGYGFAAPEAPGIPAVDHYGEVDVAGTWVVVLRDWPADASDEERRHWGRYAGLRYKAILARERGAAGLVVIQRPDAGGHASGALVPLRFDGTAGSAGIPVLTLSEARVDTLLSGTGHRVQTLREALDRGEGAGAFAIPGASLRALISIEHERKEGLNIVARLGVGDPDAPALIIGAHYDHLGRAAGRGSLARADERQDVHYGADDNASGVAAVLEIAQELQGRYRDGAFEPVRDVVFAAWSGEELGLLGSHAFVAAQAASLEAPEGADPHSPRPDLRSRFVANLNLDMVGRLEDVLLLQGGGSSTAWADLVERAATRSPVPHALQEDSLLPTDASSFVARGVPVLSGFTGAHGEYHTPRDTPERLNYPGLTTVTAFFSELASLLASDAEVPDFVAPRRRAGSAHPDRPVRLRAYLGTVPDYAAAVEGLALAAVVSEGPAEQAGLRGGDVVTALAGRPIRNVYDYTFAIEGLRPGQPIEVEVQRGGRTLRLTLVPGSRE